MKKIAIITGAGSGMGRDFCRLLSKYISYDEMWLIGRRLEKLTETISMIPGTSLNFRAICLDISGKKGAQSLRDILKEEENKGDFEISCLINNAGFGTYGTFQDTSVEREMEMIDLNCTSLTGITGYALPYMHKGSYIINTASLASFMPLGNFAVYGATKAYVLSFTVALKAELKDKGINVSALCPGSVSTEFAKVASNGSRKEVKNGISSYRIVEDCLYRATKGKLIILYTLKWKFSAFASSFVSRYLGARFTYKYAKRPNGTNGVAP